MDHRLLLAAVVAVAAQLAPFAAGYPWPVCGTTNNFAPNSTFQANFDRVAASLPNTTAASRDLYNTAVVGAVPEQVWAMALCRGDVNATECRTCLAQAFRDVQSACPLFRAADIYYNPCLLRYSDVRTLPGDDTGPTTDAYSIVNNGNVTTDPARFDRVLAALINATADHAALNSTRRFATGEADLFDQELPKVYALAQCPPDQSSAQCRKCLAGLIRDSWQMFQGHIGGRVLWVNCTYRFETAPFYNGPAMVRLPSSPSSGAPEPAPPVEPAAAEGGGRKYNVPGVVLAVVLGVLAALNLVACLCFWRRRRQTAEMKKPYPKYSTAETEDVDSMMIDISTLRAATGDFDDSNKLGEGGFGAVYKGVLPSGEEVAVKRLSQSSAQGVDELKNELALVAKLKHKNLVRLVGVCLERQERLLVYEYVPNRSLDLILFGTDENEERRQLLDWEQRYRIINGIARGLQYLHEDSQLRVVHRDLKASNILLDAKMNPKISDFGLARIFTREQTQAVTGCVVGTYGYMAPEYVMRGNYSVKSDAFSFGVMVLEIVTGRKNNENSKQSGDLLNTVWEHWDAGTVMGLVDPSMKGSFPEGDVLRCFHIGLLCVQADPAVRPVMSSVLMMLGTDTVNLHAPSKPGLFTNGGANTTESTVMSVHG